MASYRPKRLDELNSSYDKSIASQNVIKDNASAINTSAFEEKELIKAQTEEFFSEESISSKAPCADLTEDINNFIKSFGKPASPNDEMPLPRPVPVRPRPTQPKAVKPNVPVEEPVSQPEAPKAEPAKAEKPEFVMTPERSELFDEYMRIMSDEEDDDDYFKSKSRKKKKSKKAAESFEEKSDAENITSAEYITPILPSFEESDDADDGEESFSSFTDDSEQTPEDIKAPEYVAPEYEEDIPSQPEQEVFEDDDTDEADETDSERKRKNPFLQVVLILVLLATLVSALIATALQVVVKVDSGEVFADKYYIYTADETDTLVGINKGDLLIAEKADISSGDVFAFIKTADGEFGFAVKTFGEGTEITTGDNSDGPVRLRNTDLRGRVTRIYPSVGAFASLITDNFTVVIAAHILLALILILVLLLAFRRGSSRKDREDKDNLAFDEDEDIEETLEEHFSLTSKKSDR